MDDDGEPFEPQALSHTGRIMREAALHGAARPEPGEDDPREIWDPDEAPGAVAAMFGAARDAFPDGYRIAEDREHVLWALVDTFRSMADKVRNRLPGRLARNPELEAGERADVDVDAADAWNARTADYMLQAGALDECLALAAATYAKETGRPWLVREGTAAAVGQISGADFRRGRGASVGPPDVFGALRTAREMRARIAGPREGRDRAGAEAAPESVGGAPDRAAGTARTGPRGIADTDRMARGLEALFEAGRRVFPDGCQLGDELASWTWRVARIFRFRAERLEAEALERLPGHPALRRGDPDVIRRFDSGTRDLLARATLMRAAFETACGRHTALTGRDWDGGMRNDGAPQRPARYDGRTLAAAVRLGRAGYPVPPLPEGPHVLVVGGPHMTGADRARVEGVLDRLIERHPQAVLHYGAHLKGADGRPVAAGADPMIRRWADRRGVALAAHPPDWGAGSGMAERLRARNAAMLSLEPAGIVSFGDGGSVYTRELLAEAQARGVRVKEAGGRDAAAQGGGRRGPPATRRDAEALWADTVRRMRGEAGLHPDTPLAYLPRAEFLRRLLDGLRLRIGAGRDEHLHWTDLRRQLDRDIEARNGVRHVLDEGRRSLAAFRGLAGSGEAAGRSPKQLDGWTRWSVGAGSLRAAAAEMLAYPPESAAYPHAAANRIELAELVRDIEAIHEAAAGGRIRVPEEREPWVGDQNLPPQRLDALLDRARTDAGAAALLDRCEIAWPERVGEAQRRLAVEPETAVAVRRTVRPEAAVTV